MLLCRFHRNRFLTLTIIFLAAGSLLLSSFLSLSITAKAQLEARVRRGRPERGRPEGTFEDLAVVRRRPNGPARAIDAEPSTIRSPKNPLEQRNGRKVDDPWPTQLGANLNERPNRAKVANDQFSKVQDGGRNANRPPPTRSHHAARLSPPPVSDDTYVQDFFQAALGRAPSPAELTYWTDTFRAAYANGQGSVANSAHEMGKTLFESAEYAVRNSDEGTAPGGCDGNPNHHCVYVNHLYNAYLRRPPDQPSWNAWASVVPTYGRVEVRRGFDESTEFLNLMATVTPNGSASSAASSLRRQELSRRINPAADWLVVQRIGVCRF